MYGEPLQFQPGTQDFNTNQQNYSNFGYLLLGLIIEAVTAMPYVDYVRQEVMEPLDLHDVFLARMMAGPLQGREVLDDQPPVGQLRLTGSGMGCCQMHMAARDF